MSVRSADADSRENSPDHEGSPGGKRTSKKRKVLSCYACRNRKMKCDRIYPICGRCKKTGRSDQCTYDPRLLDDPMGTHGLNPDAHHTTVPFRETGAHSNGSGPASLDALRSKARAQERRIEELERKLAATEGKDSPSLYRNSKPDEPEIKEEMMFRGKGFKTQFHGSTSVMSTFAQVCLTTCAIICVLIAFSFASFKPLHVKHSPSTTPLCASRLVLLSIRLVSKQLLTCFRFQNVPRSHKDCPQALGESHMGH
jgi:hypothetical protein